MPETGYFPSEILKIDHCDAPLPDKIGPILTTFT